MQDPRAQRTLVKSPPELWAEVSDVEALARHLGEFGEIRITRLDPETTVAWEGDRACGTVALEPAGWGTKVTLTAKLAQEPASEPVAVEPEPEPTAPAAAAEPVAVEPEPEAADRERDAAGAEAAAAEPEAADPEPEAPQAVAEAGPEPDAPQPVTEAGPEPDAPRPDAPEAQAEAPKAGFFARLFGRRRKVESVVDVEVEGEPAAVEPEPEPLAADHEPATEPLAAQPEPEPEPLAAEPEPEPLPAEPEPEPLAAEHEPEPFAAEPEPVAAESETEAEPGPAPLDPERAEAILTGVLDDLGSAHHRPFSRS
jgi:hypothetical protein